MVAIMGTIIPVIVGLYIAFNPIETARVSLEEQAFDVKANAVKFNTQDFHEYLRQIAENDGVLVMGTSETGNMGGLNYFDMLNADTTIHRQFSRLGGAGRFFEVYIPLIVADPEAWQGVELMAFVNPTYWRVGLNSFQPHYFERYADKRIAFSHRSALEELGIWNNVYATYFESSPPTLLYASALERKMDALRDLFAVELRSLYQTPQNPFVPFATPKPLPNEATLKGYVDNIDTTYNVSHAFRAHRKRMWYPRLNSTSQFRNQVLRAFIQTCQQHHIKLTVVLGSYNGVMARAVRPEADVQEYETLLEDLRILLDEAGIAHIDVSETSYINGSYRDYQHHSKYGAYLKYQIIKAYYETH